MRYSVWVGVVGLVLSVAAQADVYRCTVNGKTQYTSVPCEGGAAISTPQAQRYDSKPKYCNDLSLRLMSKLAASRVKTATEKEALQREYSDSVSQVNNKRRVDDLEEKTKRHMIEMRLTLPDTSDAVLYQEGISYCMSIK